jgi:hypothetical protein
MNERIKELLKQADIKLPDDSAFNGHIYTNSLEKFAESIVKECADLFPLTFTDEHYQRRIDKTIKKHFGIEE